MYILEGSIVNASATPERSVTTVAPHAEMFNFSTGIYKLYLYIRLNRCGINGLMQQGTLQLNYSFRFRCVIMFLLFNHDTCTCYSSDHAMRTFWAQNYCIGFSSKWLITISLQYGLCHRFWWKLKRSMRSEWRFISLADRVSVVE